MSLSERHQVFDLTDYTLTLYAKQPDGNIQSCTGTTQGTAANGQAFFTLPEEFMTVAGKSICTVALTKNNIDLRLVGITLDVQPSLSNNNNPEDNIIEIHKARTLSKSVTAITDSGEPYTPVTGDVVRFAVCEDRGGTVVISKTLEWDSTNQCWQLELDPADTSALEPGTYHYDIGIQFAAGGYADIIELTDFIILPSASQMISN